MKLAIHVTCIGCGHHELTERRGETIAMGAVERLTLDCDRCGRLQTVTVTMMHPRTREFI
jgi:uncharacterized Zn finger protein